jgi:hypothetical protein
MDPILAQAIEGRKAEQHAKYVRRRETQLATEKRRYDKRTTFLNEYKASQGCLRCGNRNPIVLDFHHRDRNGKELTTDQLHHGRLEVVRAEIAKCDVLCSNCHRIVEHKIRVASHDYA